MNLSFNLLKWWRENFKENFVIWRHRSIILSVNWLGYLKVVEYNGERTLAGMSKFLETGGTYGQAAPEEVFIDTAATPNDNGRAGLGWNGMVLIS